MSAYILILPGLALKLITDLVLYFSYTVKPNCSKVKLAMMAFLTVNTFVFLVPMMPELVAIAKESIPSGVVSQAFLEKTHTEQLVGMSKVIPLLTQMLMGAFRPKIGKELNTG